MGHKLVQIKYENSKSKNEKSSARAQSCHEAGHRKLSSAPAATNALKKCLVSQQKKNTPQNGWNQHRDA
jgi:hypothetical protein